MDAKCWIAVEGIDPATVEFPILAEVDGERVVIFKVHEQLCAVQRDCPHGDADLSLGLILGDKVKCPQHGFMFRLKDGKGISMPGLDLKTFDVNTDEGALKLAIRS